jgi:hypothetical protein
MPARSLSLAHTGKPALRISSIITAPVLEGQARLRANFSMLSGPGNLATPRATSALECQAATASIKENGVDVAVMRVNRNPAAINSALYCSRVRSFAPRTTIIVKSIWVT